MFVRNLDAFTRALGVENAPAIIHLSLIPWENDEQRDEFIRDITDINIRQVNSFGS